MKLLFLYLPIILSILSVASAKNCQTDPGCKNCTAYYFFTLAGIYGFYQCDLCYENRICQCNPGYYLENSNTSTCTKCNTLCVTCSDGSSCLQCNIQFNRYLNNGRCLCIDGYEEVNSNLLCTKKSNILIIVLSSVGSVLFLIIATYGCYQLYKIHSNRNQQVHDEINRNIQQVGMYQQSDSQVNNDGITPNSLWNTKQYVFKAAQLCSICIDPDTLYMTDCGHYFHSKCIFQWLNQHQICPNCNKGLNSKQVRVWCSSCKKVLMPIIKTISITKTKGKKQLITSSPMENQMCQNCQLKIYKTRKQLAY